jgi:hypothetical protein
MFLIVVCRNWSILKPFAHPVGVLVVTGHTCELDEAAAVMFTLAGR